MAPRRRRRSRSESPNGRRRGRPPLAASSGASSSTTSRSSSSSFGSSDAQAVLSRVAQLVQENQALTRENNELKSALSQIAETMQLSVTAGPESSPINGQADAASVGAGGGGNGRRRRRGRRGRISDPSTLERRRAALAKAREVLAAKRAAAKRGRP